MYNVFCNKGELLYGLLYTSLFFRAIEPCGTSAKIVPLALYTLQGLDHPEFLYTLVHSSRDGVKCNSGNEGWSRSFFFLLKIAFNKHTHDMVQWRNVENHHLIENKTWVKTIASERHHWSSVKACRLIIYILDPSQMLVQACLDCVWQAMFFCFWVVFASPCVIILSAQLPACFTSFLSEIIFRALVLPQIR